MSGELAPEMTVTFTGCTEGQRKWGGPYADDSRLVAGTNYRVAHVEVHSWHTKVWLHVAGGPFNSVCFDPLGAVEAQQDG